MLFVGEGRGRRCHEMPRARRRVGKRAAATPTPTPHRRNFYLLLHPYLLHFLRQRPLWLPHRPLRQPILSTTSPYSYSATSRHPLRQPTYPTRLAPNRGPLGCQYYCHSSISKASNPPRGVESRTSQGFGPEARIAWLMGP